MSERTRPHLLLIDDDVASAEMLRDYLVAEGFDAEIATRGEAGLARAMGGACDAVILDVMLPDLNGIDLLRQLRRHTDVPVIMLTAKGDNVDRVVGLELGADDYVAKPYFPRELVARIRAVLRRKGDAGEQRNASLSFGGLSADPDTHRVAMDGREVQLTASEFGILMVLLRAGEKVSTKEELSMRVLGRARQSYDRSVDVHMANLRSKLHANYHSVEIETVRGVGYRLRRAH